MEICERHVKQLNNEQNPAFEVVPEPQGQGQSQKDSIHPMG
jgi:hypothetical protein